MPRSVVSLVDRREKCKSDLLDVVIRHKMENDFRTLMEWLGGNRVSDRRYVVRNDEDCREGLYWVLRLSGALEARGFVVLKYVRSGELEIREWRGKLEGKRGWGVHEIYVGITDDPSLRGPADVSAWRVELQEASGRMVAEKQSFLWNCDEVEE
jgi:hypothetical protein